MIAGVSLITQNLDIWSSAIKAKSSAGRGSNGKLELYGIKKLRELILELAVRGLLVPQDPQDEPASKLLKKIAAEKARLIKEGKIKKQKALPPISEEEKPFELPEGWELVRFGDIYALEYGNNLPERKRSGTGEVLVFGSNGVVGSHNESCINSPCIVVGRKGSAGALNLCLEEKCWVTDVAYSVIPPSILNINFVFRQFHTLGLDSLGKGIKPGLNRNEAYNLVIALPPVEEQRRIVAKVDELMTLCDQLEQQQESSISAHQTLVEVLLTALTRASEKGAFDEAWARVVENFDTLFTTEDSIDQLKQTILQLAVMGKLVPQDPKDEPASKLLKKIAAEKAKLIKDKKIRRSKSPLPIAEGEAPFEVPEGWAVVRFSELCQEVATGPFGSMIHKRDYIDGGVPLINPSHLINGKIVENQSVSVSPEKASDLSSYSIFEGDIVMARRGEIGRCAVVTGAQEGWLCGTGSFVLRFHSEVSRRFILLLFLSEKVRTYLGGESVGITMTNLNHGILNNLPVVLPPAKEQERIADKIERLTALCERLKASLAIARAAQLNLADSIFEQAIV